MAQNEEPTAAPRIRSKSKSFNDDHPNHVQFNLSQDEVTHRHDNIEIKKVASHLFDINIGYLKVDHFYRVTFTLEHDFDELVHLKETSSKNVTLESLKKLKDGSHEFQFLFYAYREKLDEEQVQFTIKEGSKEKHLSLNFEAKVLGINQGTPSLRTGVVLVSHKSAHSDKPHYSFM